MSTVEYDRIILYKDKEGKNPSGFWLETRAAFRNVDELYKTANANMKLWICREDTTKTVIITGYNFNAVLQNASTGFGKGFDGEVEMKAGEKWIKLLDIYDGFVNMRDTELGKFPYSLSFTIKLKEQGGVDQTLYGIEEPRFMPYAFKPLDTENEEYRAPRPWSYPSDHKRFVNDEILKRDYGCVVEEKFFGGAIFEHEPLWVPGAFKPIIVDEDIHRKPLKVRLRFEGKNRDEVYTKINELSAFLRRGVSWKFKGISHFFDFWPRRLEPVNTDFQEWVYMDVEGDCSERSRYTGAEIEPGSEYLFELDGLSDAPLTVFVPGGKKITYRINHQEYVVDNRSSGIPLEINSDDMTIKQHGNSAAHKYANIVFPFLQRGTNRISVEGDTSGFIYIRYAERWI